ncbi:hypothetical protein [Clostridium sp.]|uniref:hypothetical protein n=1 Tax=Clostridium sp. TaxID=1506 RepID=UPI003D6C7B7F
MIIYYPTYYLVPVVPVISIDEDEYDDEYRIQGNDEYGTRYNDEYSLNGNEEYSNRYNDEYCLQDNNEYCLRYNTEEKGVHNIQGHVDIFEEVDEDYVNESTK